jgi:DNA-binding response OmpR family regulator
MPIRFLIVDDEESVTFALSNHLARHGHVVDVAAELAEAKALIAAAPYDIVLSDLRLTGLHGAEGFELASYLRACHPRTHCVLLTAYENAEVTAEARARGARLVLRKPQPLAELRAALEGLMEGES